MARKTCWTMLMAVLMLPGVGCGFSGAGDQPDLGMVSGVVTLDSNPLVGVSVNFSPEEGGRSSSGITDADGKYELIYVGNTKGAKIGKHSVSISSWNQDGEGGGNPNEEGGGEEDGGPGANYFKGSIPRKYNTETILGAEVKAGDYTSDFKLESK